MFMVSKIDNRICQATMSVCVEYAQYCQTLQKCTLKVFNSLEPGSCKAFGITKVI